MSSSPGIHDTLGAAFIGLLFGTTLYGITILQAYQYFLKYPNDTKVQKGWVVLLFLLDTANIVFGIHAMYFYLIFRFGDLSSLQTLIWSIKPFGVAHVLVIWIVQSLYLWRIWRLTNSLRLPTWIVRVVMIGLVVIVLVGLAAGVVFLVELEKLQSILIPPSFAWVILFLGCLVPLLVDMSIATTMFFLLWSQKVDLPSRMDRVVATLVTYIVSTGVLTSLMKLVYLLINSRGRDYTSIPTTPCSTPENRCGMNSTRAIQLTPLATFKFVSPALQRVVIPRSESYLTLRNKDIIVGTSWNIVDTDVRVCIIYQRHLTSRGYQ